MNSGIPHFPNAARKGRHDPTGEVDLENFREVEAAIGTIMSKLYGAAWRGEELAAAVNTVVDAFRGEHAGLLRCDTPYHDLPHALETGLAMARLLDGYARSLKSGSGEGIDSDRALLGILLAIGHDLGMLRHEEEQHLWGAVLTPIHEERGVDFLRRYLAQTPLAQFADKAELIMATRLGFAMPAAWSRSDRLLASLVASADLLSQMADRCYLEKCRDFLFLELSAAGLAGTASSRFPDRETLLAKTPAFYTDLVRRRLDEEFSGVHRLMAHHFDGRDPYGEAIHRNLDYLNELLASGDFTRLRRQPRPFVDRSEDE